MRDISFGVSINKSNKINEKNNNEFISLKINDSLYKKDIGNFLKTLSKHI